MAQTLVMSCITNSWRSSSSSSHPPISSPHLLLSSPPLLSSPSLLNVLLLLQYLQVNTRDKQSEMKSSRSLGDLKGSLLKGGERVRKHSTGKSGDPTHTHTPMRTMRV